MKYSTWLTIAVTIGVGGVAIPAHANTPRPMPRKLPSMEEVLVAEPQRTVMLDRLADDIDRQMGQSESSVTTISDVINSDMLDGLLDENGELNLPLGLTVYNTMGDTSVGFGTKF